MSTKRKKSKKRYKKKWGQIWRKLLLLLLIGTGSFAGVDYYQNGNLDKTIEVGELVREYAEDFSEPLLGVAKDKILDTIPDSVQSVTSTVQNYVSKIIGSFDNKNSVSSLEEIPEYTGETYVIVNGNIPVFSEEKKNASPYEFYSKLDYLGRCGYAEAKLSIELMPTEERGQIGSVKPTGWHTIKYSNIDGLYLYNRCHLIGYQLAGENANEKNLITGTRYLNVTGMLPWENMIADYIQETKDSVMYRVTPIFEGENLVASGVQMEAESLGSDEICFNIYVFNVQPGIGIDYSNGNSWME